MEDITKELNSATEYLRAMKKSGHHKGDCDNVLMHLANIEDLVNKLFIADVVVAKRTLRCPECYGTNIAQNINKTRAKCIHCATDWAT